MKNLLLTCVFMSIFSMTMMLEGSTIILSVIGFIVGGIGVYAGNQFMKMSTSVDALRDFMIKHTERQLRVDSELMDLKTGLFDVKHEIRLIQDKLHKFES